MDLKNVNIMNFLIELAKKSNMRKRYACAIIYQGKIIASGYNFRKNCQTRIPDDERKSYHAERNALVNIKDKRILNKCTVYLLRIDRNNNPYPGIPCEMCSKFLERKGIQGYRIYTLS